MESQGSDWEAEWAKVQSKAWSDEEYKRRLMEDPASALREVGINPPPGMQVKVVENTETVAHIPLYPPPQGVDVSAEVVGQTSAAAKSTCSASYWDVAGRSEL